MTILHSTSQNELCGPTARLVTYVVWVFRSWKGGFSRASLGQGWMLPIKSNYWRNCAWVSSISAKGSVWRTWEVGLLTSQVFLITGLRSYFEFTGSIRRRAPRHLNSIWPQFTHKTATL